MVLLIPTPIVWVTPLAGSGYNLHGPPIRALVLQLKPFGSPPLNSGYWFHFWLRVKVL